MKKKFALILCLCLAAMLPACSTEPAKASATQATQTTVPIVTTVSPTEGQPITDYDAHMISVALPMNTESHFTEDNVLLSTYSYQNVSIILPDADIAQIITLDLLNRIDASTVVADAVIDRAAVSYSGQTDWYPYFYNVTYNATRIDQNVLSFAGTESSYDGSPRSVYACHSVNYDLATGNPLSLRAIMHEEYSADALCDLIIDVLGHYEEGELFPDYVDLIRDKFSTNVPVETWYFSTNGLCFYFAPYEIASNAMGTIVAEIPYEKLSGLMKDQFFPSEKLNYVGEPVVEHLTADHSTTLDAYTQFAELELEKGKEQLLLHVDGSVLNLQVLTDASEDGFLITLFSAAGMGPTDALIIELDLNTLSKPLVITYESAGRVHKAYLSRSESGEAQLTK